MVLILLLKFQIINGQNTDFEKLVNIKNKILALNKNKFTVSWRQQLINPFYTEAEVNLNIFSYDFESKQTYFKNRYIDYDTIYTNILFGNGDKYYYFDEDDFLYKCKKPFSIKNVKKYWMNDLIFLAHPLSRSIVYDTNKYYIKVVEKEFGDSIEVFEKDSVVKRNFYVSKEGRILYYREEIYTGVVEKKCFQTIIYDSIKYSNETIDFKDLYKYRTCPKVKKVKRVKPPSPDSFFLNKRFNYEPLKKHIIQTIL